jgi:hypothetical protein
MATFTSYGATINVPDKYAEGQTINAKEAAALNARMAEFISHRIRASVFPDLNKGDVADETLVREAQARADELVQSFEFGAERAPGEARVVDPVEKEALALARKKVRVAVEKSGQYPGGISKKGEEVVEGQYSYDRYLDKVAEYAKDPRVLAKAKQIVKARNASSEEDVVDL